jgi:hypothetical protein
VVAQCHANGTYPVAAQRLINRAADLAISPDSDEMQWCVADHWSDPFETLLSNRGDCEDCAILKYAALPEAGIPKDDVKIVILKNFFPNENHAAVATRVDGQWLILDNHTLTLVRDTDAGARSWNSCSTMQGSSDSTGRVRIDELAADSYARFCAQLAARDRRRSITAHPAN